MAKVEASGTQNLSAKVKKTIQSIKEIVGNHSDADIYSALKEANMDPNETAQKLLNQEPFHEVRRRRDKKKESEGLVSCTTQESRQNFEQIGQERKSNPRQNQNPRRSGSIRPSGVSHQFRVVRDNRVNQNKETDLAISSPPTNDPASTAPVNSRSVGTSSNQKQPVEHQFSQRRNGHSYIHHRQSREANPVGTGKEVLSEDKLAPLPDSGTQLQNEKANNTQLHSVTSSSSSAVEVYSSSSDPVHVPSRDSRQAANVGVGVVGARRQSSESGKLSSTSSNLLSNHSQNVSPESSAPASSVGRSFSNNQYGSRAHQSSGHSRAPQPSKEWKPKMNKKATTSAVGAIGSPTKAALPSYNANNSDNSNNRETEAAHLKDKHSPTDASENQNVIIAAHIRVSESDRYRLTFGSLGAEFETASSVIKAAGIADVSTSDHSVSESVSTPVPSGEAPQKAELIEDRIQSSGSNSSVSTPLPKPELADKKVSSSSQNMDNYGDIGLIRNNNPAYSASESHQQVASELPSFSEYEQTAYNIPYLRPPVDEAFRRQGLQSPQEALSSHPANSIPANTIALSQLQQQQQQLAQVYPQLHYMPYRQVFPPFYVPPMAMPGYSSNPAYPHPANGSSYVLMPGGSSHLTAGNVKYGMQQFKPVPTASPTGFGNYSNPTGYAINTPGVVGGGTGLEDAARLKYKDSNLYVPNAQADTSEMWMNTKEIPSMQSASYYSMPGQTPHTTAYLPSHAGHASFNAAAAAAQSSHMQFPAMYHPQQPGTISSPHPLGAAMVGSVGTAASAPLQQVGAYQQPQLGHLNWTGNLYEYS